MAATLTGDLWGQVSDPRATSGYDTPDDGSVVYCMGALIQLIDTLSTQAKEKIEDIAQRGENISIADMFDMQMNMNHLAQMSEMSTSVVNSTHTTIMSMARNIKG